MAADGSNSYFSAGSGLPADTTGAVRDTGDDGGWQVIGENGDLSTVTIDPSSPTHPQANRNIDPPYNSIRKSITSPVAMEVPVCGAEADVNAVGNGVRRTAWALPQADTFSESTDNQHPIEGKRTISLEQDTSKMMNSANENASVLSVSEEPSQDLPFDALIEGGPANGADYPNLCIRKQRTDEPNHDVDSLDASSRGGYSKHAGEVSFHGSDMDTSGKVLDGSLPTRTQNLPMPRTIPDVAESVTGIPKKTSPGRGRGRGSASSVRSSNIRVVGRGRAHALQRYVATGHPSTSLPSAPYQPSAIDGFGSFGSQPLQSTSTAKPAASANVFSEAKMSAWVEPPGIGDASSRLTPANPQANPADNHTSAVTMRASSVQPSSQLPSQREVQSSSASQQRSTSGDVTFSHNDVQLPPVDVLISGLPDGQAGCSTMMKCMRSLCRRANMKEEVSLVEELPQWRSAIVRFHDEEVARQVVQDSPHTFTGTDFSFCAERFLTSLEADTVFITGKGKGFTKFDIRLAFEDILEKNNAFRAFHFFDSISAAAIEFKSHGDAGIIMRHKERLKSEIDSDIQVMELCSSLALLVCNLPKELTDRRVQQYFRNNSYSGGSRETQVSCQLKHGLAIVHCPDTRVLLSILNHRQDCDGSPLLVQRFSMEAADSWVNSKSDLSTVHSTAAIAYGAKDRVDDYSGVGELPMVGEAAGSSINDEFMPGHFLVSNLPRVFEPEDHQDISCLRYFLAGCVGMPSSTIGILAVRRSCIALKIGTQFDYSKGQHAISKELFTMRSSNVYLEMRRMRKPCSVILQGSLPSSLNRTCGELFGAEKMKNIEQFTRNSVRISFHSSADAMDAKSKPEIEQRGLTVRVELEGIDFPTREDAASVNIGLQKSCSCSNFTINVSSSLSKFIASSPSVMRTLQEQLCLPGVRATIESTDGGLSLSPRVGAEYILDWSDVVKSAVHDVLETLGEERLTVPDDLVHHFMDVSQLHSDTQNIHVSFSEEESALRVVGIAAKVNHAVQTLQEDIDAAHAKLLEVTETCVPVDKVILALFKKVQALKSIESECEVRVSIEEKTNMPRLVNVRVSSQRCKVEAAVAKIESLIANVTSVPLLFPKSQHCQDLMTSESGVNFIQHFLESTPCCLQSATTATSAAHTGFKVLCQRTDESDVQDKIDQLLSSFVELVIELSISDVKSVLSADWATEVLPAVDDMKRQGLIAISEELKLSRIRISGQRAEVDLCRDLITDFLTSKKSVMKSVMVESDDHLGYLKSHQDSLYKPIVAKYEQRSVSITLCPSPPSIVVNGPEDDVLRALGDLKAVTDACKVETMTISQPGINDHFGKPEFKQKVLDVGRRFDVAVKLTTVEDVQPQLQEGSAAMADVLLDQPRLLRNYTVVPGKRIEVYEGDITTLRCAAITNACNEQLRHTGGVAKAISQAAGKLVQEDCVDFIQTSGHLLAGEVYPSNVVGNLSCQMLVHAIAPKWKGSVPKKAKSKLKECVSNILNTAQDLESVAIPAISSGVYGFPEEICAEILVTTAIEWINSNTTCSLSRVIFIDINSSVLRWMVSHLEKAVPYTTDKFSIAEGPKKATKKSRTHRAFSYLKDTFLGKSHSTVTRVSTAGGQYGLQTKGGLIIHLEQGNITYCKTTAIVNSCNSDLDLQNSGPLAKSLSHAAGPALQADCLQYTHSHGRVEIGDFCSTAGHNLRAKRIYHSVVPTFTSTTVPFVDDGGQVLESLVIDILVEANDDKMDSIAFPALGAGSSNYPSRRVAEILFSAVLKFSNEEQELNIKKVVFCILDAQVMEEFVSVFSQYAASVESTAYGGAQRVYGAAYPLAPAAQANPSFGRMNTSARGWTVPGGQTCVEIKEGDLLKEVADAVVTTVLPSLDMSKSALSRYTAKAAGGSVQAALNALKSQQTIKAGEVYATAAGKLSSKHIIHATMMPVPQGSGKATIENLTVKCLQEADTLRCQSICLPALGAGGMGVMPEDCAAGMIAGVQRYFSSGFRQTSLRIIRLVLYEPKFLSTFRTAMQPNSLSAPMNPGPTQSSSLQVSVTVGSVVGLTTDAIVTNVMPTLDMKGAALSKNVALAAGDTLQAELNTIKAQRSLQPGEACSTGCGKLPCKYVIHAVVDRCSSAAGIKVVENAVLASLKEADRLGCTSLALPAIGAGGLGHGVSGCANATANAIECFRVAYTGKTSLTSISMVIFDPAHESPFKLAMQRAKLVSSPPLVQTAPLPFSVSVIHGDILTRTQSTDVIVINALEELNMSNTAMSKNALQTAGSSVQTELNTIRSKRTIQPGDVCSTAAGNLKNCSHIIHAVLQHESKTNQGRQFIEDVVVQCLEEAEELQCTSVAIPALGAGGLQFPIDECASATMSAIIKYGSMAGQSTTVKRIDLVMFDKRHELPFESARKQAMSSPRSLPLSPQASSAAAATSVANGRYRPSPERLLHQPLEEHLSSTSALNVNKSLEEERRQERAVWVQSKISTVSQEDQRVYLKLVGPSIRSLDMVRKNINKFITDTFKKEVITDEDIGLLTAQDDLAIEAVAEDNDVVISYQGNDTIVLQGDKYKILFVQTEIMKRAGAASQDIHTREIQLERERLNRATASVLEASRRGNVPDNWTTDGSPIKLIPLVQGDGEYAHVSERFRETCSAVITKIERVENAILWHPFQGEVQSLKKETCSAKLEIMELWHGCNDENVDKIYSTGWDKAYAGQHAVAFGRGAYFAKAASYSYSKFARPRSGSQDKRLILAHVVVRDVDKGKPNQLAPPYRNESRPQDGLVSALVDNVVNPSMYVTFRTSRSYPAYVVTCK